MQVFAMCFCTTQTENSDFRYDNFKESRGYMISIVFETLFHSISTKHNISFFHFQKIDIVHIHVDIEYLLSFYLLLKLSQSPEVRTVSQNVSQYYYTVVYTIHILFDFKNTLLRVSCSKYLPTYKAKLKKKNMFSPQNKFTYLNH